MRTIQNTKTTKITDIERPLARARRLARPAPTVGGATADSAWGWVSANLANKEALPRPPTTAWKWNNWNYKMLNTTCWHSSQKLLHTGATGGASSSVLSPGCCCCFLRASKRASPLPPRPAISFFLSAHLQTKPTERSESEKPVAGPVHVNVHWTENISLQ